MTTFFFEFVWQISKCLLKTINQIDQYILWGADFFFKKKKEIKNSQSIAYDAHDNSITVHLQLEYQKVFIRISYCQVAERKIWGNANF